MEEINLNYKDKASLESGSGKGYTGKGSTGNRHYGSRFFFQHVFVFVLFSSSGDEGATLHSLFDLPLKCSLSHSFLSVRVAPVRTVGTLFSLDSCLTDSRCLRF